MTDLGAPAKRGEDTPVPTDIETRKLQRTDDSQPDDQLIPKSFLEQRAEERQSRGHTYADLYVAAKGDDSRSTVNNPLPHAAAAAAPQPAVNPVAAQAAAYAPPGYVMPGYGPPAYQMPVHQLPGYAMPAYPIPGAYSNFAPGGQIAHPMQYGQPRYGIPFIAPQEPWKPGQRAASLWGSFLQHTIFAIAVQVFLYGSLFLLLAATSWQDTDGIFVDDVPTTLTDFMVWLAKPEHLLLSFVLVFIVVGALSVIAYYSGAAWQRAKGLRGRAKSFWLTSITGGSITFFTFLIFSPITLFAWLIFGLLFGGGGNAGLWSSAFIFILLGGIINGFVCMGFGRLFLSKARPPIDFAKLAAEAEARARAEDERALAGEPAEERYRIQGT